MWSLLWCRVVPSGTEWCPAVDLLPKCIKSEPTSWSEIKLVPFVGLQRSAIVAACKHWPVSRSHGLIEPNARRARWDLNVYKLCTATCGFTLAIRATSAPLADLHVACCLRCGCLYVHGKGYTGLHWLLACTISREREREREFQRADVQMCQAEWCTIRAIG